MLHHLQRGRLLGCRGRRAAPGAAGSRCMSQQACWQLQRLLSGIACQHSACRSVLSPAAAADISLPATVVASLLRQVQHAA